MIKQAPTFHNLICLVVLTAGACNYIEPDVQDRIFNERPVAKLSGPEQALVGQSVAISAAGSTDDTTDSLGYEWSLDASSPESVLTSVSSDTFEVESSTPGDVTVTVKASDGIRQSQPVSHTVTFVDNEAPEAVVGSDRTIQPGESVELDASDSNDPDGQQGELEYEWSVVEAPSGSDLTLESPEGARTPIRPDVEGIYILRLRVTDAFGATDTATVTIQVEQQSSSVGQPGDVLITEIMPNPVGISDARGEWFEIFNPSEDITYDLEGCILESGEDQRYGISQRLVIKPESYATVATSPSPGFSPTLQVGGSLQLSNTSDSVSIKCGGKPIDSVAYDESFPFEEGASMFLKPSAYNRVANDSAGNWGESAVAYSGQNRGAPNQGPK